MNPKKTFARKRWIDVTVPLKSGMVHWPGDPEIQINKTKDMERGDDCTVSTISMGSHTGTHMDAPLHYIRKTPSIDQMEFEATVGPARVIEILDKQSVKPDELKRHGIRPGERILLKTINSANCWTKGSFVKDFVAISLEAALHLAKIGIRSVGIDYLSVGGFDQNGAAIHRALLSAGIWIIEGLNLSGVQAGRYDLICLPLRMFQGDGAPARAILRSKKKR